MGDLCRRAGEGAGRSAAALFPGDSSRRGAVAGGQVDGISGLDDVYFLYIQGDPGHPIRVRARALPPHSTILRARAQSRRRLLGSRRAILAKWRVGAQRPLIFVLMSRALLSQVVFWHS